MRVQPEVIVGALFRLGGESTAVRLCDTLSSSGLDRAAVQLGIQRAIDSGDIWVRRDLTLCLPETAELLLVRF